MVRLERCSTVGGRIAPRPGHQLSGSDANADTECPVLETRSEELEHTDVGRARDHRQPFLGRDARHTVGKHGCEAGLDLGGEASRSAVQNENAARRWHIESADHVSRCRISTSEDDAHPAPGGEVDLLCYDPSPGSPASVMAPSR